MKLCDMAPQYVRAGCAAGSCIARLEREYSERESESERRVLRRRIRLLHTIRREMLDMAELSENYYRRGYTRDGRYTL